MRLHSPFLLLFASAAAFAQSTAAPPAFEAATIKPAPPSVGGKFRIAMGGDPGRINYSNVSLKDMIKTAYDVKDYQVSGPDWIASERFDVVLAERFKLVLHRDKKELPVYALVVGKNGPKIHPVEGDRGMFRMGRGHLEAQKATIASLTDFLSRMVDRPVLDMTQLKGNYDITLDWTPDENQPGLKPGVAGPPPSNEGAGDSNGASIFTAIQETLGLKLEARKAPVELLVVDHAEKVPTEN